MAMNTFVTIVVYIGVPVTSFEAIYSFYMGGCKSNSAQPANCDLPLWLAVQSALLCVNSKLRTPLGKAQDTFLAIEGENSHAANIGRFHKNLRLTTFMFFFFKMLSNLLQVVLPARKVSRSRT